MADGYYGLYRGIVMDNKDPENMGRLKLAVPSVYGNDDESGDPLQSNWALPKYPIGGSGWGMQMIPPVKNPDGTPVTVWVEFEQGDSSRPVWSGFFIRENSIVEPLRDIATKKPYLSYGFTTPRGNRILIDDNDPSVVEICDRLQNKIVMDEQGIKITDKFGNFIQMYNGGVRISGTIIDLN